MADCHKLNVQYIPPVGGENQNQCKVRRKKIRNEIKRIKNMSVDTTALQTEQLPSHSNSNVPETNMVVNETDIQTQELLSLHSNPKVVEAVKKFESGELWHTVKTCIVCMETKPIFHVTEAAIDSNQSERITLRPWKIFNDGCCTRCHKERLIRQKKERPTAAKFSGLDSLDVDMGHRGDVIRHNNMHFAEIPPYLKYLSTVEMALISRITVVMNVHLLRYGMMSSKGHCVSLPQEMTIASCLPLLPTEVGIVVLRRKGSGRTRQYTVQRDVVEKALKGLCYGFPLGGTEIQKEGFTLYNGPDHVNMPLTQRFFKYHPNPYYRDVEIRQDRLNNLPHDRIELPDLPVIDLPDTLIQQDQGPAEAQFDLPFSEHDESTTRSGIAVPLEPRDVDMELKLILDKFIGEEGAGENALKTGKVAGVDWDKMQDQPPLNELKTPGFFAMAYPTIFINGTCDFTTPKLVTMEYDHFVEHIYFNKDNRVSKHPFLKFFLYNLGLRMKALKQGSFLVAQQLQDAHLTIPELRANLENEDESVPRKILSVAANLPNTDPYWRERKKELDALTFFRRKEYGDLPAYFDTNSCAEYHWKPLMELLIKYHAECTNMDLQEVRNLISIDYKFRRELVLDNLHIVTSYFDARTINYFSSVIKELMQYDDVWWRYEFAKSRGEIHSHAIVCSSKHAKNVQTALETVDDEGNCLAGEELRKWLQSTGYDNNGIFSPQFTSMHPAGGQEKVDEHGNLIWIPDKTQMGCSRGNTTTSKC